MKILVIGIANGLGGQLPLFNTCYVLGLAVTGDEIGQLCVPIHSTNPWGMI